MVGSAFQVRDENGGKYINGIPRLKWGQWKDLSYIGTLYQIFNAAGATISYEDLMGVSGLCYQFSLKPDYDFSSALPQNGTVRDDLINAAVGYEGYTIADSKTRTEQIKKSIANGFPVACMGQHGDPEWGMLLGYNGVDEFFGRSFLDVDPQTNGSTDSVRFFTENNYQMATDYPGVYPDLFTVLYDRECPKMSSDKLLHASLELCQSSLYDIPSNDAKYGVEALTMLITGLSNEYTDFVEKINFNVGILLDSRRAAYIYLKNHAGDAGSRYKQSVMGLSSSYQELFSVLSKAIPYDTCYSKVEWDFQTRQDVIESLRQALEIEKKIHEEVVRVLTEFDE